MGWRSLGQVDPARLVEARENLHWAAQVLAAAGETHLPALEDTSHTALVWLDAHGALASAALGREGSCRLALRLADLTLLVVDSQGTLHGERSLAGLTLAEALREGAAMLGAFGDGTLDGPLERPTFELPDHPLGGSASLEVDPAALAELARWVANADLAVGSIAERAEGASPVLTWPHHFDHATLIAVETDATGAATKTIGIGCSPGDEAIPAPYYYVSHWPAEEVAPPGEIEGGDTTTEGWTGAVLPGAELVSAGDAGAQQEALARFLETAVAASRTLLAD